MKYRMETPLDKHTPPECAADHGRVVDVPIIHHNATPPCRCQAIPVEPIVPESFGKQWRLLMDLLAAMRVDDMAVIRRGWHMRIVTAPWPPGFSGQMTLGYLHRYYSRAWQMDGNTQKSILAI